MEKQKERVVNGVNVGRLFNTITRSAPVIVRWEK